VRSIALAFALASSSASAQSLWERAIDTSASRIESERATAENEALLGSLNDADFMRLAPQRWNLFAPAGSAQARLQRQAIARYEGILRLRPDDVDAMVALAQLYDHERDWAAVVRFGTRALDLAPDHPDGADVWFTLSIAHTWLDAHAASRDDYLHQLRYPLGARVRSVALGNLADTYVTLEDLPRAIEAYEGALAEDPDYALAWLGLAVARDMDHLDPAPDASRALMSASNGRALRSPFPFARGLFRPTALLEDLGAPGVFFVPTYLVQYHRAVAHEATAREFEPGGHGPENRDLARDQLGHALDAWRTYVAAAPATDPWRARAEFHARRLEARLRAMGTPGAPR
jgi:tetratricopeptide (TPR) repeat protein